MNIKRSGPAPVQAASLESTSEPKPSPELPEQSPELEIDLERPAAEVFQFGQDRRTAVYRYDATS